MTRSKRTVRGIHAPTPRPTLAGALWLALLLGAPVALILWGAEVIWRLAG